MLYALYGGLTSLWKRARVILRFSKKKSDKQTVWGECMEDSQKATQLKSVADLAGVSMGTVSIVLNGRGDELRISKATQERVRRAASELRYTPNMAARRLRKAQEGMPRCIVAGFVNIDIMRSMTSEYITKMFAELFLAAKEKGIEAEFVIQPYFPSKLCDMGEMLNRSRYSGVIINSATDADVEFLKNNDFSVPIVVVNRDTSGKYMNVHVNDYEGGKKSAEIFSGNGHKRAAIIGMRDSSFAMRMRKMGFEDECRQAGIELRDDWIVNAEELTHDAGFNIMNELLSIPNGPTAYLIMSDGLSLGSLNACKSRGVSIPDDVEIIVYGVSSAYDYCSPSLTSFAVSNRDIAHAALDLLILAMKDKSLVVNKSVFVQFTYRESCRPFKTI